MKVVLSLLAILAFSDATYNYGGGYRGYGGYNGYRQYYQRPAYGPFAWYRPGWGIAGVQPHYYMPTAPMPATPMTAVPMPAAQMPAAPMPAVPKPAAPMPAETETQPETEVTQMEKRDAEALPTFEITKTTPWKSFSLGFGGHGGYRHYEPYGGYGGYRGYRQYYGYPYGYGF